MTLEEHYEIERAEGREEGMAEGLEKGRAEGLEKGLEEGRSQMVRNSLKYGNSIEQTALILGLSIDEVTRFSKMR